MRTLSRVLASMALLSIPVLYSSCGDGGGGGTGPDQPPVETLASFELTVPDSIAEGEAFSLTVTAVGSRGAKPLTSYSGTVSLSTTQGTVSPSSLTVSGGTGSGQVALSAPGPQTLTVSGGGRSGSATVDVVDLPEPPIPGEPEATLEQAVPDTLFVAQPEDYSNNHPDLPGLYLSHNTILLAFQLGTTVEQANAILGPLGAKIVGANRGAPGVAPSILFLRLPTTDHAELDQVLTTLRADGRVLHAVQDALLQVEAVPDDANTELGWEWESDPNGGNWGLELSRVPQMWNLNQSVEKLLAASGASISTGVIDAGFVAAHEDLVFENLTPFQVHDHGTHVAGIIGATFGNPRGIDGVNPFADLVAMGLQIAPGVSGGGTINRLIWLALVRPGVRVVNISLGFGWSSLTPPIDTNTNLAAQNLAAEQGAFVLVANQIIEAVRPVPIITKSTGNDSDAGFGPQLAKYASSFGYAAIQLNAHNIVPVENVALSPTSPGSATRRPSSNVAGGLSAPGTDILSTVPGDAYAKKTGTSMAGPFMAGIIGYMLAIDPTLTIPEVRDALFQTSVPVGGGASNRVDAWAAVLDIDRVQGNDRILKMMLDIDDGTIDGNLRVDYDNGPDFDDYEEDDADWDGGIGDGDVDMSDFRTWRDWYLKIWESGQAQFDGREDHPKLDVNNNGVTEDSDAEAIYPRGDFNGDGILSLEDSAFVPGGVQGRVSDLDVFKLLFDDPHIDKDELDTLVLSSDVTVDASIAFDEYTNPPVKAEMWQRGMNTLAQEFELTAQEPRKTFTVRSRPGGYWLEVRIGTESRFADNGWRVLATTPGTDAVMWPIKPIPVNEKSTFLNSCDDPGATTAQAIPLQSLQVEPGEYLYLEAAYDSPRTWETVAVFSASDEIKVDTEQIPVGGGEPPLIFVKRTVTDAIPMGANLIWGNPFASPPTQKCGGKLTDIPQDFHLLEGAFLKIPDGATHLFLGMASDYYDDNGDGEVRVRSSKWYAPEWHDMHQPVSRAGRRE